ncbi:hypothetical protein BCR44DRAFT_82548, partial [Catenaria anguillulae PL171]
ATGVGESRDSGALWAPYNGWRWAFLGAGFPSKVKTPASRDSNAYRRIGVGTFASDRIR